MADDLLGSSSESFAEGLCSSVFESVPEGSNASSASGEEAKPRRKRRRGRVGPDEASAEDLRDIPPR
jgi:hypothetical protein